MPKTNDYTTSEKVKDIAKWTWEGMVRDSKKALKGLMEGQKRLSQKIGGKLPPKEDEFNRAVIKPNPGKIEERFKDEEAEGIKRGPGAWGRK